MTDGSRATMDAPPAPMGETCGVATPPMAAPDAPTTWVAAAPPRPLLVWDGDCGFCRTCVTRCRVWTGPAVDYATSAEVAGRYPEIPAAQFASAVQLIGRDGVVASGAAAILGALAVGEPGRAALWAYRHVPGVAAGLELLYRFVARRRMFFGRLTRRLAGGSPTGG